MAPGALFFSFILLSSLLHFLGELGAFTFCALFAYLYFAFHFHFFFRFICRRFLHFIALVWSVPCFPSTKRGHGVVIEVVIFWELRSNGS